MAWEEFERNGVKGISGDTPIDELDLALKRIVTAYEDRFSRKPTVSELLYALETVVTTHPTRYVSDAEGLKFGEIMVNRNYQQGGDYVDKTQYEAVYTEATVPGYYVVLRRNSDGQNQANTEVIKIPTLELQDRTLICQYELLTDDITDQMAETLIVSVLLDEYCDRYYEDKADKIEFINVKSQARWTSSYVSAT
ncbi:hypothetical protein [Coleofasciculus sp.]|uniref:hypothetical protein n=1 Tax=Coleofasciculus sp. TaxID=3100458 RepID=UPI003A4795AF